MCELCARKETHYFDPTPGPERAFSWLAVALHLRYTWKIG